MQKVGVVLLPPNMAELEAEGHPLYSAVMMSVSSTSLIIGIWRKACEYKNVLQLQVLLSSEAESISKFCSVVNYRKKVASLKGKLQSFKVEFC